MKRVNIEEKTRLLNEFRMANVSKTFTRDELIPQLKSLGISTQVIGIMIPKFFPSEKLGNSKLYGIPKEPIHKSLVAACYKQANDYKRKKEVKPSFNESEAISNLRAAGYQIRKCIGFDVERFERENPVLYKKYLKYETL